MLPTCPFEERPGHSHGNNANTAVYDLCSEGNPIILGRTALSAVGLGDPLSVDIPDPKLLINFI